jgi:hypothetical protein
MVLVGYFHFTVPVTDGVLCSFCNSGQVFPNVYSALSESPNNDSIIE